MKSNALRSVAFSIVCMLLGVLIALQMKNVNLDNISENNLSELQNKIIEYANKNSELSDRNSELYQIISILENDKASGNTQIDSIIKEKERAAVFAGLREVHNAGIKVQISCAEDMEVSDSVIRQFVNELRSLGAQAISVNDERLVAMSEIRGSGTSAIMINGTTYNRKGKFEIKSIIDPKKLDYYVEYLGLVRDDIVTQFANDHYDIQIESVEDLTIPALSEDSIAFRIDLLTPTASK